MKKISLLSSIVLIILASCGASTNSGESNQESDPNAVTFYTDSEPFENDFIKLTAKAPSCSGVSNYYLTTYFELTNKEYKTNDYTIKNIQLIKESTQATYSVSAISNYSIEAELSRSISFSSTIPSLISKDNYKLSFELNSYKVTYYLYETPDELRADRMVSYSVGGKIVYTTTVKDKRSLKSLYLYETEDYMSYCDTWYTDLEMHKKYTKEPVTEDLTLYGQATSNLKFFSLSIDAYASLSGINHIPSNRIIVIPESYDGKKITIGIGVFKNISVDKIYIPKTIQKIYSGNFVGIGNAKIYYAGSQEEWEALFYSSSDIVTKNVIYNAG